MMETNAVDVSIYQPPWSMNWAALRDAGIELAIVKATQALWVDRYGRDHWQRATAAGLPVAFYHFLDYPGDGRREAEHHVRTLESWGALDDRRTFVLLDWEANAVTGAPAAATTVAREFMLRCDELLGANRAGWYSYRSLANLARPSMPWPLWLADPNPNAAQWAEALDAFLVQTGETNELPGHPFTLLTDHIYNRDTLAQLQGGTLDMPLTKDDAQLIVCELLDALGLPIERDALGKPRWPVTLELFERDDQAAGRVTAKHPPGSAWAYMHEEAKRGKLAAMAATDEAVRAGSNAGMAAQIASNLAVMLESASGPSAPTVEQLAEALRLVLRQGIE